MARILGTLLLVISASASAADLMERQGEQAAPSAGEALVVFVSPADSPEFTRMQVVDVTEPVAKLVGFIEPGTKVLYRVKPGSYLFMLNYTQASFLDATLAAGKTYYAVVSKDIPRGRFSVMNRYTLHAVRGEGLSELYFARAERNASAVIKSSKAEEWFRPREKSFTVKKNKFLPAGKEMSEKERAQYTLQESDGR